MSNVQLINRATLISFSMMFWISLRFWNQITTACMTVKTIAAILDTANAIAEDKFWPHAATVDANEADFDGVNVTTPPEVKEGLDAYREAGFFSAGFNEDVGGMQLPWTVFQAMSSYFTCASPSTLNYAFLTSSNANMLNELGSDELKAKFLPKLVSGRVVRHDVPLRNSGRLLTGGYPHQSHTDR